MIHVTEQACWHFAERIRPCSMETARDSILASARAIEVAAAHGFEVVRRGDGSRLIIAGDTVLDVLQPGVMPYQIRNPFGGAA